jgi:hypothetical protein
MMSKDYRSDSIREQVKTTKVELLGGPFDGTRMLVLEWRPRLQVASYPGTGPCEPPIWRALYVRDTSSSMRFVGWFHGEARR